MIASWANNSGAHAFQAGPPSKMSDPIPVCSRCGKPMTGNAFALALENELPDSVPRALRLCPRCTKSFERWYGKRGKSSSNLAAGVHSEGSLALAVGFGATKPKRRHRRKRQMHRVFVVAALTVLVFIVTFSWTWTILKSASRVDE
jgi:hypothetical protein